MKKNTNSKGFTLIELMIVIAIIAILAGIAAPNFQTYMAQRRLNGAARQVMTNLMEARSKAVSFNQKVKVFFKSDQEKVHEYEIWNDADGNGTVADNEGDDIELDIHPDYHDVTFSASADPVFQARGTAMGSTITLTNSSGTREVSVSTAGRVKIN
ncbi:MAG: GspH/FimT family pseudopilin [Deltaproteobacteria bacterium]|nr:GspH/FimT family pseudopilin [Deltaproteobacteria bacterium]